MFYRNALELYELHTNEEVLSSLYVIRDAFNLLSFQNLGFCYVLRI